MPESAVYPATGGVICGKREPEWERAEFTSGTGIYGINRIYRKLNLLRELTAKSVEKKVRFP
jgi:hypothetical protein